MRPKTKPWQYNRIFGPVRSSRRVLPACCCEGKGESKIWIEGLISDWNSTCHSIVGQIANNYISLCKDRWKKCVTLIICDSEIRVRTFPLFIVLPPQSQFVGHDVEECVKYFYSRNKYIKDPIPSDDDEEDDVVEENTVTESESYLQILLEITEQYKHFGSCVWPGSLVDSYPKPTTPPPQLKYSNERSAERRKVRRKF